jgi:hypothetical protein
MRPSLRYGIVATVTASATAAALLLAPSDEASKPIVKATPITEKLIVAAGTTGTTGFPLTVAKPLNGLPVELRPCSSKLISAEALSSLINAKGLTPQRGIGDYNSSWQQPKSNLTSCAYSDGLKQAGGMATVSAMVTTRLTDINRERYVGHYYSYDGMMNITSRLKGALAAYIVYGTDDPAVTSLRFDAIKHVQRVMVAVEWKGRQAWLIIDWSLVPVQNQPSAQTVKQFMERQVAQLKRVLP